MKEPLNEKFSHWTRQGVRGKENYEAVFPYKGGYVLRSDGFSENLIEWGTVIWENGKIVVRQQWKKEEGEVNVNMAFVIRKQKEIIIYDGEETFYSFGLEKGGADNEQVMIYYQSNITGTLIMASSKCPRIRMLSYVVDEPKTDAVIEVMERMWELSKNNKGLEGDNE